MLHKPWCNTYNTLLYVFFSEGEFCASHLFTWHRWSLALQIEVVLLCQQHPHPNNPSNAKALQVVDLPNSLQNSPIGHHSTLCGGWQLPINVLIVYIGLALAFQIKWTILKKHCLCNLTFTSSTLWQRRKEK